MTKFWNFWEIWLKIAFFFHSSWCHIGKVTMQPDMGLHWMVTTGIRTSVNVSWSFPIFPVEIDGETWYTYGRTSFILLKWQLLFLIFDFTISDSCLFDSIVSMQVFFLYRTRPGFLYQLFLQMNLVPTRVCWSIFLKEREC